MAALEAKWTRNGYRRTALKLGDLSSTESVEAEEQLMMVSQSLSIVRGPCAMGNISLCWRRPNGSRVTDRIDAPNAPDHPVLAQ